MKARDIVQELKELGDPADSVFLQGYFKTGKGQYGEGDRFLGIRVPVLRKLSRAHQALSLPRCRSLLRSPFHEARLLALLILVRKYGRGDEPAREAIYRMYLTNTKHVNNWDLVDLSAPNIVGVHLASVRGADRRSVLDSLARSVSLWERRIAILATSHFIRDGNFDDTFRIADILLHDREDLIHKAVGWMLREVGNRDRAAEQDFLRGASAGRDALPRYSGMPRTMLRYATEKFPERLRKRYLAGTV